MFEVFTDNKYLLKYAPPEVSNKNLPEWWKQFPAKLEFKDNKEIADMQTMRSCPVIKDFLNAGLIIKLWTNVKIFRSSEDTCSVEFLNEKHRYSEWHNNLQVAPDLLNHSFSMPIKLFNPFNVRTPKNVWTYVVPYEYGDKKGMEVLQGIVKTDSWHSFNFVFKLNVDVGETKTINFGTPIARLLPFHANMEYKISSFDEDQDFKSKVDEQEFQVGNIEHAYLKETKN